MTGLHSHLQLFRTTRKGVPVEDAPPEIVPVLVPVQPTAAPCEPVQEEHAALPPHIVSSHVDIPVAVEPADPFEDGLATLPNGSVEAVEQGPLDPMRAGTGRRRSWLIGTKLPGMMI